MFVPFYFDLSIVVLVHAWEFEQCIFWMFISVETYNPY